MGKNISIYFSPTHMSLSSNAQAQKKKTKPDMEFKYQTRLKNSALFCKTLDITSYLWLWWAQQLFFFFPSQHSCKNNLGNTIEENRSTSVILTYVMMVIRERRQKRKERGKNEYSLQKNVLNCTAIYCERITKI